jgi:hypothetical protein
VKGLTALVGIAALMLIPAAHAAKPTPPLSAAASGSLFIADPGVVVTTDTVPTDQICGGTCDAGGAQGCGAAATWHTGDWSSGTVWAWYHWCWDNGRVYDNYGWDDHNDGCSLFCAWAWWNDTHDFGYGHLSKGTFKLFSVSFFGLGVAGYETVATCVAVDGFGDYWGC